MNEKIIKKVIGDLYSDCNIKFKSFERLNRKQFINGKWVDDTPSFFIGVDCGSEDILKINEEMSSLIGCEINMFIV